MVWDDLELSNPYLKKVASVLKCTDPNISSNALWGH